MTRTKVLEKIVLTQVLQYLRLKKYLCYRMNTGAALFDSPSSNGKRRFVRFGEKGMADVLAFTKGGSVIWIECKGTYGKQSEHQKSFQKEVESFGHIYVLSRGLNDIKDLFEGRNY